MYKTNDKAVKIAIFVMFFAEKYLLLLIKTSVISEACKNILLLQVSSGLLPSVRELHPFGAHGKKMRVSRLYCRWGITPRLLDYIYCIIYRLFCQAISSAVLFCSLTEYSFPSFNFLKRYGINKIATNATITYLSEL